MEPTIAILANGRILVKREGESLREVRSTFATEAEERQKRSQAVDGWRSRSGVWGQMGMAPPQFSQWEEAEAGGRSRISFRSLSRGSATGQLMYILDLQTVRGLFQYDLKQDLERRLMHRNEFFAHDLAVHPVTGTVATALEQEDGSSHLAFSDDEGRHWNRVAGGDSRDESPAWIPGEKRRVVFHSAAIGRTKNGMALGLSEFAIETLDLDGEGKVQPLLQQAGFDLLQPKLAADDTLYFIRRPYKAPGEAVPGLGEFALDLLLLPYRFLRSIFLIFNFLSLMVSGQPLSTSLTRRQQQVQQNQLLSLWGQAIDTKKAMQKYRGEQAGSLVPKEWELVRRDASGAESVLATNVLAFDLGPDKSLIYTNGSKIHWLQPDGARQSLGDHRAIERVVCLS